MMENILSPLKSVFMAWLNPRSTSITTWAMDMILAFVCGVGLFHLLIPYLQRNRFLPTSAKRKRPGKTHVGKKWRRRCRKRSDAREVTRDCLEKLEVTLNLAFVLQNYLGKLQDQEDLHQRLHNDATNESLKPDTKRAQQTLEQRAESPSPSLPRVSLAPLTECSLHLHHLGKQSNFNGISLGTFPWSYFLENADMILYPWTTLGLYSFHRVIYLLCCWWESAKTLFLRTWAYGTTFRPESMFPQPTEISFQRDSRFWQTVAGGISFIKNNIQLLEMFISKKVSQKLCKEKGKGGPFFTPLSTGYPPGSLGSLLKSQNERHIVKNLLWEAKTEMWQQPTYPQGFYSKDELDPGDLKRSQFFWGLPSLHSESLVASAWLQPRSSSRGTKPFTFNNVFLTESPPNGTVHLSRPQDVAQSQLNTQKLSPPASKVLTEDHFPYSFSNQLHSAPLQINSCRTSGMTSERWDLEWSLKEQLKCEEVLTSKLEITQEITDQTTLLLPQESRAPQMNKLDCTFPRNSTILECQKPEEKPSLPEEATDSKWQPFPSPRIPESQLMQHQEKFPGKYECQPQNEHELLPQTSQPTALTCESKIGPTCSDQVQAASHLDNPDSPCQGIEQDLEPLEHTHVSKSDWMMPKKYSRSHLPRTLDKKFLEVHLERKLEQMKQGMIPVRVRQSLLTRSHAFSKPSAPAKPHVVSCTNQPSRVNTFKELSFLDTESRLMLETNTVRCWMKHRWYPQLQARDSSLNVLEDPASPLPQPGSPSGSCDSEVAKPDECSQKDSGKEEARSLSVASLKLLFSAPSPAEIQRSQGHNPSHVSHRYLEACLSEQKNSLSRQPSTSSLLSRTRQRRTVLESVKGGQEPSPSPVMSSHKSQEESVDMVSRDTSFNGTTLKIKSAFPPPMTRNTKERAEVKKEMPPKPELPAETSLLQISQITHMNLKTSESQGTSNSPFSRKFSQDPGYAQQKAQVICEIQCKLGIDLKQPQNPATDNFQHIYTDKPPITDNLSPKASLTSTQSTCQTRRNPATSQIPCDLWMKGQSQGKQETSDIRVKAQGQNLSNTFDFHADRQDCGKSGPVLQGRVKPSQSWESSPSPQDRKVGSSGKMISHKMGPHPSEKTKIQNTLQFLHPDPKSQDKEDSRPRVECPLATIQSRGAEASKLCTDSGAREAQTLRKPGGQILLNKTGPWHYHGKESQDIHANYQDTYANYQDIRSNYQDTYANYQDIRSNYQDTYANYQDIHSNYQEICSNYQGIRSNYQDTHANNHVHPSDPERTPVMIGVSCGHQASHRGNGHSTKNGCATNKASTQSLLSREPVSLVRPCLDRLGGGHNSGHIFHHPIHYH